MFHADFEDIKTLVQFPGSPILKILPSFRIWVGGTHMRRCFIFKITKLYIKWGVLIWFPLNSRNSDPRNFQFLVSFSFETLFSSVAHFISILIKARTKKFNWGDDHFAGFDNLNESNFQFGYFCSGMTESKPHKPTKVKGQNGEWRDASGKSSSVEIFQSFTSRVSVKRKFRKTSRRNAATRLSGKRECVFPMVVWVIWSEFRMGQYRVNDHPYHAPQYRVLYGHYWPYISNSVFQRVSTGRKNLHGRVMWIF